MGCGDLIAGCILGGTAVQIYCCVGMIRCEFNLLLHINDQVDHLIRCKLCFFLQGQLLIPSQVGIVACDDKGTHRSCHNGHDCQGHYHFYKSESFFPDTHSQPPYFFRILPVLPTVVTVIVLVPFLSLITIFLQ